jgi:hypothetical protein
MTGIDWTIVLGLCGLGGMTALLWHRHPNLAAAIMVAGVTALGVVVSALSMPDPRTGRATDPLVEKVRQTDGYAAPVALATSVPVSYPSFGPMAGMATGGAAPPASTNPYAIRPTRPEPVHAQDAAAQ